jgi:hypothetical protein
VDPEAWEERVTVGWSMGGRDSLHQDVRASWVEVSRARILEAPERERRVE